MGDMKNLFRTMIFLAIGSQLIACGQSVSVTVATSPTSPPSVTQTATISATTSPTATATIEVTPRPTYVRPTLIPTIDPTRLPELIKNAFSLQTFDMNGYKAQRITGWEYGFGGGFWSHHCPGYYWLDTSHLLAYPRTGQQWNGFTGQGEDLASQPTIINIRTGHVWLPNTSKIIDSWNCNGVYWSSESGVLITPGFKTSSEGVSKEAVFTHTFDGQPIAYYWGKLVSVSPSQTKIVMDDNAIIDLKNNKVMRVPWNINYEDNYPYRIHWSSDDTHLYRCCYHFADISTEESFSFELSELRRPDNKPMPSFIVPHAWGRWVRNNAFFLITWNWVEEGDQRYIPMFDPVEKIYYDVREMAEIPTDLGCPEMSVSPNGMYTWVWCWDASYLINLETFSSVTYPLYDTGGDIEWSKDGEFAAFKLINTNLWQILSVSNQQITPTSVNSLFDTPLWWHPKENVLIYISEDAQKLELWDARTMSTEEVALPTTFQEFVWSPNGNQITMKADDGSLWQIDYPTLENLEQLTQPMPDVRDVFWSPEGNSIAFVSGSDIYIVDITK